jgi:beta-galactosidase
MSRSRSWLGRLLLLAGLFSSGIFAHAQGIRPASFIFGDGEFLLGGKPFQIIGGEMHPARIPAEYWRHRIKMAKAMGCNTISAYVFWNHHEVEEGRFDFETGNRNLPGFLQIAQEEGIWVLLRPGPYCCAEWDLGGLPSYLLKYPDIKLRCMDPRYLAAAERYLTELAKLVRPFLVSQGGPILMIQIENEYGSYGNDRRYLDALRQSWTSHGIPGPFFTADGPTQYMLEAGTLPGCAVGLDSGGEESHWALAGRVNPGVPTFSSETYPGWLTHWGEPWARVDVKDTIKEVGWLLENRKSFSLYVVHGGTNFGWMAGANSGGKGYEPDLTSYDYDAPIGEQGEARPKYAALRTLISSHLPKGKTLPAIPDPIPVMDIQTFMPKPVASIWNLLPKPVRCPQPVPMEALGQKAGFLLYRARLIGHRAGLLTVRDVHDYATVFVNGQYLGKLDRRLGEQSITIPATAAEAPVLDILVEGMGRINFAEHLVDRKGITDRVTLNGMTLMDWEIFRLPMEEGWILSLPSGVSDPRPGTFFKGTFDLKETADTFLDLKTWKKGVVWVNGHNLGRYWDIGPQTRLYCPAPWLKKGLNEVVIFDLHQTEARPISGRKTLND